MIKKIIIKIILIKKYRDMKVLKKSLKKKKTLIFYTTKTLFSRL